MLGAARKIGLDTTNQQNSVHCRSPWGERLACRCDLEAGHTVDSPEAVFEVGFALVGRGAEDRIGHHQPTEFNPFAEARRRKFCLLHSIFSFAAHWVRYIAGPMRGHVGVGNPRNSGAFPPAAARSVRTAIASLRIEIAGMQKRALSPDCRKAFVEGQNQPRIWAPNSEQGLT